MLQTVLILCSSLAAGPSQAARADASTIALPAVPATGALRVGPGWLSGARNDYNLSVDSAQRRLVFARSDADFANSRVWIAERGPSGWSAPREAPFSLPDQRDSDPWLTPDGRTLYFVSSRPAPGRDAGRTDLDVWRVAIDASGALGAPEHLGPEVNSEKDELGPELHEGWLYFGSSRPGGPAPFSIYRARLGEGGAFSPAEALPRVVNSGRAQGDPTFSPKGDVMVFWRLREGTSDGDLYALRRQGDGWAPEAVRLPEPFSSSGFDFTPSFTPDGTGLYFASDRAAAGLSDIYLVSTSELYRLLDRAATAQLGR